MSKYTPEQVREALDEFARFIRQRRKNAANSTRDGSWSDAKRADERTDKLEAAHKVLTATTLRQQAERGDGVVRIVCDWSDADPFPHFIEAETPDGKSISLPWHDRADGLKEFHLYLRAPAEQGGRVDGRLIEAAKACADRLQHLCDTRLRGMECAEAREGYQEMRAALTANLAQNTQGVCEGCNGHGEVGGLTPQGYDGEECPFCHGTGKDAERARVPDGWHREWRSALTLAAETMEVEQEHMAEGGHDDAARRMKRSATVIRSILAAPSQPQPAQAVDVGAKGTPERRLFDLAREWGDNKIHTYRLMASIEAIIAEVRALSGEKAGPAGDGWLPIETAPKDGRELILLLTPSRFPQVAWSNTWWTAGFSVECKPTHWMRLEPLPASPAPDKEGEG